MSAGPSFKSIVFVSPMSVRLWTLNKKDWTEFPQSLYLDKSPSTDVVSLTQGSNVLVLVSDSYAGHLQFLADNKKDALTDEAIGQRLQDEFQIDISAYEFATQRASLSRDKVQVSVSGLETGVYQDLLAWLPGLMPKKLWIMPFSWFLVPLKSVEPVLLAVENGKNSLLVSHHYLGVDDARELSFEDLAEYVISRKEERKETHLLYVQAASKTFKKIETTLGEVVAVHPLMSDVESEPLQAVISEVMLKGSDTLAELLHFEEAGLSPEDAIDAKEADEAEVLADEAESDSEADSDLPGLVPPVLPTPVPPVAAPSVSRRVLVETDLEEVDEDLEKDFDEPQVITTEVDSIILIENADDDTRVVVLNDADDDSEDETREAEEVESAEEAETAEEIEEVEETPVVEVVDPISRMAAERSGQRAARVVDATPNDRYREVKPRRSWGGVFLVFFGMVALTVIIGGAVYWSQQVQPQQQALIPSEVAPTPTPVPTPAPTPVPTTLTLAEKKQLNMVVYNATTRAGLAGRYQSALNEAGWNVTSTGNATGEYEEAGVFIFTSDDAAFETLAREMTGVSVRRMEKNGENSAATVDVVVVINQPVEPAVEAVE